MIYNDAYCQILGAKHPDSLGALGRQVWPEIWHIIGPMLENVLHKGEATWSENQLLLLDRYGYAEECYFTFSYSPIHDESGKVGGVFCAVTETSEAVIGERHLKTLRDLGKYTANAKTTGEVLRKADAELSKNQFDFPFIHFYEVREQVDGIVCTGINASDRTFLPAAIDLNIPHPLQAVFAEALRRDTIQILEKDAYFDTLPRGAWEQEPQQWVVLPIGQIGQTPAALMLAGVNPHRRLDEKYLGFLSLVTDQLLTSIANANAYENERTKAMMLAELDRAKTTFFSNVSHEFRTPLTLMLGPLQDALDKQNGATSEDKARLQLIQRNAKRLHKLVNNLLDFSRIEAGRIKASYQATDLAALTRDLASSFRAAIEHAGLKYDVVIEPLTEPVYVDREMWEKIVLNLLSNAYKFTFEGKISLRLQQQDKTIILMVADTGIGIPEKELPNIFKRFHRVEHAQGRTHEGSGIGLSLVQELVKLHGGTVTVKSVLGKGTIFEVSVPLGKAHLPAEQIAVQPALASTALDVNVYLEELEHWNTPSGKDNGQYKTKEEQATASRREYILVADDNADMRLYIKNLLNPLYEVQLVQNGEAALQAIQERLPDLLLTDIMMPRLDGFELLKTLRQNSKTQFLPVILLSARAGEEARIEGIKAGADAYLVKPFNAQELKALIKTTLQNYKSRQEVQKWLLVEREKMYHVFMKAPIGVVILNANNYSIELVNTFFLNIIQNHAQDFINTGIFESASALGILDFPAILEKVSTSGQPYMLQENKAVIHQNNHKQAIYLDFVFQPYKELDQTVSKIVVLVNDVTDKVEARKKVEAGEQRLQLALDTAHFGVWTYNFKTGIHWADTRAKEMHGNKLDQLVSMQDAFSQIHPDDLASVKESFANGVKNQTPINYEYRYRLSNGETRWIASCAQVHQDNPEEPPMFFGLVQDITEQKQAEAALRESEERFAKAFNSSPMVLTITSLKTGKLLEVNETFLHLTGYTRAETIGHTTNELGLWSNPADREAELALVMREGAIRDLEYRFKMRNGRSIIGLLSAEVIEINGEPCALTVIQDITERKRTEEALRTSEKRYRELIQALPAAFYTCDTNGHIRLYNQAALDLWGRTPTIGRDLWCGSYKIFRPDGTPLPLEECPMAKLLKGQPVTPGEEIIIEKLDGERRNVLPHPQPIYDLEGNRTGAINMLVDITELRRIEQSLLASEERYRAFVSQSSEAIWRFELEKPVDITLPVDALIQEAYQYGYLAECNDAMAKMYGFEKAEEIVGARLGDLLPASNPVNIEYLRAFIAAEFRLSEAESQEIDRDGQHRYFLNNLIGITENGYLLRAWGTQRDISERKKVEEALRASQHLLSLIYDNSLDCLYLAKVEPNDQYRFVSVNQTFLEISGYTIEQVEQHLLEDVVPAANHALVRSQYQQVLETRQPVIYEETAQLPAGLRHAEITLNPIFDADGSITHILGALKDVTDRWATQNALRESEERFAKAFNASPIVLTISSIKTGKLIEVNETFVQLSGFSREEVIGKTTAELGLWSNPQERTDGLQAIKSGTQIRNQETKFRIKNGEDLIGLVSAEHIEIGGEPFVLTVLQDITERKRTEQNQQFLLEIIEDLAHLSSPEAMMELVGSKLGKFLNASRCGFTEYDQSRLISTVTYDWCAEGQISTVGTYQRSSFFNESILQQLNNGKQLVLEDAKHDPRTADRWQSYQAIQLGALVTSPYLSEGICKASLNINYPTARQWRSDELQLIQEVSDRVWSRIEHARAEEALRSNENQLRLITDALPALISYIDKDQYYRFVNRRYTEWFGLKQDEIIGKHVSEVVGDAYQWVLPKIERVLSGEEFTFEGLVHYQMVGDKYIFANFIPDIQANGEVKGWYALVQDISERKQAEEALRESEEKFRNLADSMSQLAWMCDELGFATWYNQRWYEYTGTTFDTMKGDGWKKVHHPDHLGRVVDKLSICLKQGKVWEDTFPLRSKDGEYRWFLSRAIPIYNENGDIIRWLGTNTDITEQKNAETALRQINTLIELSYEPIFIWDLEKGIIEWNVGAEQTYGYTRAEALGKISHDLLQTQHPFDLDALMHELKNTGFWTGELQHVTKDGRKILVETRHQLIETENGRLVLETNRDITQRKETEANLREREQELRTLANSIAQLAWMAEPDGHIFWYNNRWYEYTGTTLEQMEGWGWQLAHHPNVLPQVMKMWKHSIATGEPFEMEFPLKGADGVYRWFLTRANPLRDSQGNILRWFGTNTDIDELRRLRESIAASEQQFKYLANAMPQVVWIAEPDGTVTYYNNRVHELEGITQVAPNQWNWQPMLHPEDEMPTVQAWQEAVRTQTTYTKEHRLRTKAGDYRWYLSRGIPVFDAQGNLLKWYGTATEIDELKRTQQELVESQKRFEYVADTVPVLIWQAGLDKGCYYLNKGWLDFTGRTLEQEQGHGWAAGIHPDDFDECLQVYNTAFDKREVFFMEYRLRYHDGTYRWIYDRGVPTYDANGNFTGYLGGCIDIQERKEAEEQKDAFIHIAGHELRTPLTSLLGYLNLMQKKPTDADFVASFLQKSYASALKMRGLISDFLFFSNSKPREFSYTISEFDFDQLVEETVENFKLSYPHFTFQLQGETGQSILGDRSRIEQVISNLLNNAIKYSDKQQKVAIDVYSTPGKVGLKIKDFGIGIEPQDVHHIFDRFYRAGNTGKIKGMGLGLFIVKEIVEYHQGSITLESKPGEGTVFTLELPIAAFAEGKSNL